MCACACLAAQLCPTLCNPIGCSPSGSSAYGDSSGKNTGILEWVAMPSSRGSSQPRDQTHCKWILYRMSHQGSPRVLEWVAYPFSRGSSRPRNLTGFSCIADGFFTNRALGEALVYLGQSHSVLSDALRPHGLCSLWNTPGQNTRVGSLSILQGIFPTQGSNADLPHCRPILYQLSHKGSPRILGWVAYPFSSGSS